MKSIAIRILLFIILLFNIRVSFCSQYYIAISLNSIEKELKANQKSNKLEFFKSLNRMVGFVVDPITKDIILIGHISDTKSNISINEFVVALRSFSTFGAAPLVSIDRNDKTSETRLQDIRFLGGVENTQFGKYLLDVDIILKKLGLGIINANIWGIKSYYSMCYDSVNKNPAFPEIASRFWFQPVSKPGISYKDGVLIIEKLKVEVSTQVLSSNYNFDFVGNIFSQMLTDNYDELSVYYPEIDKLKILYDLVVVSKGISELKEKPDLSYWLNDYQVPYVSTPQTFELIEKKELLKNEKSKYYVIDGGIDLDVFISRLKDGDVTALKEAVLFSRPSDTSMRWRIPADDWYIPGSSSNSYSTDEKVYQNSSYKTLKRKAGTSFWRSQQSPNVVSSVLPNISKIQSYTASKMEYNYSDPSKKYSNNVGGVLLSNSATTSGKDVSLDLSGGNFSMIIDGNAALLEPSVFRQFITSLWSVYFDTSPPGISIDPIAFDTSIHVQMVRYIGNVINNDLGRVMREADYKMKKWAIGSEKPNISGFKDVDELMSTSNINYYGASRRFWFVPEDMRFIASNNFLMFDTGRMTLKTEYIFLDNKSEKAEPSDIAFANFFTQNYLEIAKKYKIYKELFDYAKYVALSQYLKRNRIPLLWYLLANKNLIVAENSPGTVKQLVKGSKFFEGMQIIGGVDLHTSSGNYVYDDKAIDALEKSFRLSSNSNTNFSYTSNNISNINTPFSFNYDNRSLSVLPQHSNTSGKDFRGIRYQTDLSLWYGSEPGLELVRFFDSDDHSWGAFGRGWKLLVPYQVVVLMKDSVRFEDYIVKKYCVVKNLITNRTDTLVFNSKKYAYAGYIPVDTTRSEFILLIPSTDGSFELADKLGNTYAFDPYGNMTEMILGNQRGDHYQYNFEDCDPAKNPEIPLTLDFGDKKVRFGNYEIISEIKLTDQSDKSIHSFIIDTSADYFLFKPKNPNEKIFEGITLLSDQSFLLTDKAGGKYYFDPSGCIYESMTGYEYKVSYEYFDAGVDRFEKTPFLLEVASNETVNMGDFVLPKSLLLINKNLSSTASYVLSDTSRNISYYTTDSKATFSKINMLTNGYFIASDKSGNEVYFDGSGAFYGLLPSGKTGFPKTVKQGEYKAEFYYTLFADNSPVISKIKVYKEIEGKLIYTLNYKYDELGFLVEANSLLAGKTDK